MNWLSDPRSGSGPLRPEMLVALADTGLPFGREGQRVDDIESCRFGRYFRTTRDLCFIAKRNTIFWMVEIEKRVCIRACAGQRRAFGEGLLAVDDFLA